MSDDATIMIVDDDEDIRDITKLLLESAGYAVLTAMDGIDAWRLLNAGARVSLILLDMMMPRMDGEQFLQSLRGSPRADLPVVIMSGHTAARQKARELGANGCLIKPVDLDELLETVRRFTLPEQVVSTAHL